MEIKPVESIPSSPYFITADAGYCHLLPDNIIITTHTTFKELPPSVDKINILALSLGALGVAFGSFLMVNFLMVGMYLMGIVFLGAMLYATKALADVARYSTITNIARKQIEAIEVRKPMFGYLYLLIRFRNSAGKTSLRKIKLYDSQQNEQYALQILKETGLIA